MARGEGAAYGARPFGLAACMLFVVICLCVAMPAQARAETYDLSLDYGYDGDAFGKGDGSDTGFFPDWSGDFAIEGVFRPLGQISKRHIFFGNYPKSQQINVELQGSTLRVYSGGDIALGGEEDTVSSEKDLAVSFAWKSETTSFVASLSDATNDVVLEGTIPSLTTKATYALLVGASDYRQRSTGETSPFDAMSVRGLTVTVPYEAGSSVDLPTPQRPGHTFSGWFTQPTGGTMVADGTAMPEDDTTYYARWDVVSYNIAYEGLEGALFDSDHPLAAEYAEEFAVGRPRKGGYSFEGWHITNMEGGSHKLGDTFTGEDEVTTRELTFAGLRSSPGVVTFTAVWARVRSLTFDYGDLEDAFAAGKSMTTGMLPNWNRNLQILGTFDLLAGDGKRYFLFGSYPKAMHVNFEVTVGGALRFYAGRDVESGGSLSTDAGFDVSFSWEAGSGAYAISASGVGTSANLTGTWSELVGTASSALRVGAADYRGSRVFDAISVEGLAITEQAEVGVAPTLPEPLRPGFEFDGWYTAKNGGVAVGADDVMPDQDTTYYAHWSAHSYQIAYTGMDGASFGQERPASATCGETFTVGPPIKPGYVFNGWDITGMDDESHRYGDSATSAVSLSGVTATTYKNLRTSSGTVTFAATWRPAVYLLTYELDGGAGSRPDDASITYGTNTTLATGDGFGRAYRRFLGWSPDRDAILPSWAGRQDASVGALVGIG